MDIGKPAEPVLKHGLLECAMNSTALRGGRISFTFGSSSYWNHRTTDKRRATEGMLARRHDHLVDVKSVLSVKPAG